MFLISLSCIGIVSKFSAENYYAFQEIGADLLLRLFLSCVHCVSLSVLHVCQPLIASYKCLSPYEADKFRAFGLRDMNSTN